MDQNQATNQTIDNDLQKAIDDITNTTNVDPVFSDPVAAPSSVPEGDTGELGEPIGPFPNPTLEVVPPAPEPIAPLESMNNIPDLETFSNGGAPMPPVPSAPGLPETPTTPADPAPEATPTTPAAPMAPEVAPAPESNQETASMPTPTIEQPAVDIAPESTGTNDIKRAALRDLIPLLGKVQMESEEKFDICRDIYNDLKDASVLEPAYQAAREITDDTKRAEALLYLVKSIDNM